MPIKSNKIGYERIMDIMEQLQQTPTKNISTTHQNKYDYDKLNELATFIDTRFKYANRTYAFTQPQFKTQLALIQLIKNEKEPSVDEITKLANTIELPKNMGSLTHLIKQHNVENNIKINWGVWGKNGVKFTIGVMPSVHTKQIS